MCQKKTTKTFVFVIRSEFSSKLLIVFSEFSHMFCRLGKCKRNSVLHLHYTSTSNAISFTLKVLRLYKNIKLFYLKQSDGSKRELKNYTMRNTDVCVIYVGRRSYRGSIAFEMSVGMSKRKVNRINLNGPCS